MRSRLLEVFAFWCALILGVEAQTAPTILSQPQSITVNNASAASFNVVATNVASYQWQLNGSNIEGATNSTYSYDNVTTNQAGSYTVVVTAPGGATTNSQPAVLTIVPGTLLQITFSGYADGSSSNVIVQLFDHDKPATVENFYHYITPAVIPGAETNVAFSNMTWDRCIPGFVLQGGSFDVNGITNSTPPAHFTSIGSAFTSRLSYVPIFPAQVSSEFSVGPLIHNTFGTMAMALQGGNQNSANNAFFFNLTNNSSNLDNQAGGFTVFGRVISGSNVLQYFNTLSKPNEGIFDTSTISTNSSLGDLPVNFDGWSTPANTNLFVANFTLLTTNMADAFDTNPPVVTMIYPTNGQTVTNAEVLMQGTASDDVSVARVVVNLVSGSQVADTNAIGTTDWVADFTPSYGNLPPATYTYHVLAQDGAGNLSTNGTGAQGDLYGTFIVPRFFNAPSVTGNGSISPTLTTNNTSVGSEYTNTATPGKGAVFANWVVDGTAYLNPELVFYLQNGMQITANFISNNMPAGGVSFTYPAANASLTNATFSIQGKVSKAVGSAKINLRVFSSSSSSSLTTNMVVNATYLNTTNTWSTPLLPFAPGSYVAQAIAEGTNGKTMVITQKFTILAPLTVIEYGHGTISIPNGTYKAVGTTNTITATAAAGEKFLSWDDGGGSVPTSSYKFVMSEGLTLTATFVSNSLPNKLTFTAPTGTQAPVSRTLTLSGKIVQPVTSPQVACQIFQNNTPLAGFLPATINGTSWTLPVSNLTMGTYNAVAMLTDGTGKTTLVSDTFSVNYYPLIAGTYTGLFFDPSSFLNSTNLSVGNEGEVSFTLTSTGLADGTIKFPLHTNILDYTIYPGSGVELYYPDGSFGAFDFTISFDVTNFSGEMYGSVTTEGGTFPLTGYRTVTKLTTNSIPATGDYPLNLAPSEVLAGPSNSCFASAIVSAAGNMAVAGTMADNSVFSFSTGVATNGAWPVYSPFLRGYGVLIGWETNTIGSNGVVDACDGQLYWIRFPANGGYYPGGIGEQLSSAGSKFVAPKPGTNYQIIFSGGTLGEPITNTFSFKTSGTSYLMEPGANTTDNLTGTLLATGVIKGSINNKTIQFSGVFVSPVLGGSGFTVATGTNTTGSFMITNVP